MPGKNRRYFMMGGFDKGETPGERADIHEQMRADMIAQSGVSPEALAGARAILKAQHADREPVARNGTAMEVTVKGERVQLHDSHVNAHGETVMEGYRRNGPRLERIRIRQVQAGPHTRIVTEAY